MNRDEAIVTPAKGKNAPELGAISTLVGSQSDLEHLVSRLAPRKTQKRNLLMSQVFVADHDSSPFAVAGPLIGAPYAVLLLETLIRWGAREILFFGWCGAVSPQVKTGDIVLPETAFIDEGTSRHYQPDGVEEARGSARLLRSVQEALVRRGMTYHRGKIWSTDAIFRETPQKVRRYQAMNALAVEMEVSALYTVGWFRQVHVAAVLVVSDELSTLKWRPGFKSARFAETRQAVCGVISELWNQR